jgi:hypothetical protein
MNAAAFLALVQVAVVALLLQTGGYPTAPPALPTATPSPGRSRGQVALPPPALPVSAGPLAQVAWLGGTWTCSRGLKLAFAVVNGSLSETMSSPEARGAASLTYDRGRWVWNGQIALDGTTSPLQLFGADVDVSPAYLDLAGKVPVPGGLLETRMVRRKTGPNSFEQSAFVRAGSGDWQRLPGQSCRRK